MASDAPLIVDATLEQVREIAAYLRGAAAAAGLAREAIDDLELAVVEAANNIVDHGYAGRHGRIEVSAGQSEPGFFVELVDDAPAFPEQLLMDVASSAGERSESGRGLAILWACTDAIEYRRAAGRNHLRLIKAR